MTSLFLIGHFADNHIKFKVKVLGVSIHFRYANFNETGDNSSGYASTNHNMLQTNNKNKHTSLKNGIFQKQIGQNKMLRHSFKSIMISSY